MNPENGAARTELQLLIDDLRRLRQRVAMELERRESAAESARGDRETDEILPETEPTK